MSEFFREVNIHNKSRLKVQDQITLES